MKSASSWSRKHQVPLIFDPLISAYDKQVFERKKFTVGSPKGIKLLNWEKHLFQSADLVIGDTREHCAFFHDTFDVDTLKLIDIPVGAEETVFRPKSTPRLPNTPIKVLFYGSFLGLQGPQYIVEAAKQYQGPEIVWQMIGDGPLLEQCKKEAQGLKNIEFIPWVPYEELPTRIQAADIILGIFGTSSKAHRVIPNKVYQALACGKPLITMHSPAYPESFSTTSDLGIHWVPPGNPRELAKSIAELAENPPQLLELGEKAYNTFTRFFSEADIERRLGKGLQRFCS